MEVMTCANCKMTVVPKKDGACPSCGRDPSQNPFDRPQSGSQLAHDAEVSKLRRDLEKAVKARWYTMMALPLVSMSTVLQYVGVFAPGNLPAWFGLVVVAICVIQLPILSRKIAKLEVTLAQSQS